LGGIFKDLLLQSFTVEFQRDLLLAWLRKLKKRVRHQSPHPMVTVLGPQTLSEHKKHLIARLTSVCLSTTRSRHKLRYCQLRVPSFFLIFNKT